MGRLLQSHSPGADLISYIADPRMRASVESLYFFGLSQLAPGHSETTRPT